MIYDHHSVRYLSRISPCGRNKLRLIFFLVSSYWCIRRKQGTIYCVIWAERLPLTMVQQVPLFESPVGEVSVEIILLPSLGSHHSAFVHGPFAITNILRWTYWLLFCRQHFQLYLQSTIKLPLIQKHWLGLWINWQIAVYLNHQWLAVSRTLFNSYFVKILLRKNIDRWFPHCR